MCSPFTVSPPGSRSRTHTGSGTPLHQTAASVVAASSHLGGRAAASQRCDGPRAMVMPSSPSGSAWTGSRTKVCLPSEKLPKRKARRFLRYARESICTCPTRPWKNPPGLRATAQPIRFAATLKHSPTSERNTCCSTLIAGSRKTLISRETGRA